jgi:hypothetical protein
MANLKAAKSDDPKTVDQNGRPEYAAIPDLQPRLDEKREALEARIDTMNKQDEDARKAFPPAPGTKIVANK